MKEEKRRSEKASLWTAFTSVCVGAWLLLRGFAVSGKSGWEGYTNRTAENWNSHISFILGEVSKSFSMFGLPMVYPHIVVTLSDMSASFLFVLCSSNARMQTQVCVCVSLHRKAHTNLIWSEKNFLSGRLVEWQSLIVVIMGSLCHCR